MKRADFQILARTRLRDARALLSAKRPAGAYYLAGQAVECALFPARDTSGIYTHDLTKLLATAKLRPQLEVTMRTQPALEVNWTLVKDWTHDCRYNHATTMAAARDLYRAVTRRNAGVMRWIRQHW